MKNRVQCPGCRAELVASPVAGGRTVTCPKCRTPVRLPEIEPPAPRPPRRPTARTPETTRPSRRVLPYLVVGGVVVIAFGVVTLGSILIRQRLNRSPTTPPTADAPTAGTPAAGPLTPHDPVGTPDQLRHALAGSRWGWGSGVQFKPDGYVACPDWDVRGLVTRWEAVDRRTVVLTIVRGRDRDRYAVLTFGEDVRQMTGYDFEGGRTVPPVPRLDPGVVASDGGGPESPRVLQDLLTDSVWAWGDADLTFRPNGATEHSVWEARFRLRTEWIAIDGRTVLLRILSGRTSDLYAILLFSHDVTKFTGYDFHGNRLGPKDRVK